MVSSAQQSGSAYRIAASGEPWAEMPWNKGAPQYETGANLLRTCYEPVMNQL